jgi:hypothetical protein
MAGHGKSIQILVATAYVVVFFVLLQSEAALRMTAARTGSVWAVRGGLLIIVALVGVMTAAFVPWGMRNRLSAVLVAVLLTASVLSFSFLAIPGISMRLWGEAGLSTSPALVAVVWGSAITTLVASYSARRSVRGRSGSAAAAPQS